MDGIFLLQWAAPVVVLCVLWAFISTITRSFREERKRQRKRPSGRIGSKNPGSIETFVVAWFGAWMVILGVPLMGIGVLLLMVLAITSPAVAMCFLSSVGTGDWSGWSAFGQGVYENTVVKVQNLLAGYPNFFSNILVFLLVCITVFAVVVTIGNVGSDDDGR